MSSSKWNKVAPTAKQSGFKVTKKRKKSAQIRLLKEISRRLAFGIKLPPEALEYAKGQVSSLPGRAEAPPRQESKVSTRLLLLGSLEASQVSGLQEVERVLRSLRKGVG